MVRRLVLLLLVVVAVLASAAEEDEWDAEDLTEAVVALWNVAEALVSFLAYAQKVGAWTALLQAAVVSVVLFGVYEACRPHLEAFARDKKYQRGRIALHVASAWSQASTRNN